MLISFFSHEMFKLIATYHSWKCLYLCTFCPLCVVCVKRCQVVLYIIIGDIGDIWGIANVRNSKWLLNFEEHKKF